MASFPRAVIWDGTKKHHLTVCVYHEDGVVTLGCSDCLDGYELPIGKLDGLRKHIAEDTESQVVLWVEDHGPH